VAQPAPPVWGPQLAEPGAGWQPQNEECYQGEALYWMLRGPRMVDRYRLESLAFLDGRPTVGVPEGVKIWVAEETQSSVEEVWE